MVDIEQLLGDIAADSEAGVLMRDCYGSQSLDEGDASEGRLAAWQAFREILEEIGGEWRDAVELLIAENRLKEAKRLRQDASLFDDLAGSLDNQPSDLPPATDEDAIELVVRRDAVSAEALYSFKERVSGFLDDVVGCGLSPARFVEGLKSVEEGGEKLKGLIEKRGEWFDMPESVLVRYGELFLKSGYVKRRFEDRLLANLAAQLGRAGLAGRLERLRNRALVYADCPDDVARTAARVFGVTSTSPVTECGASMDEILAAAVPIAVSCIRGESSFAVRAKRSGDHPYSSMDVERTLGAAIVEETGAAVDLGDPDTTVEVDVEGERVFVCTRRCAGVRGLPYGTQGRVLAVFDGTDDSVLAAFMLASRGAEIVGWVAEGGELASSLEVLEGFLPKKIKILEGGTPQETGRDSRCQAVVWGARFEGLGVGGIKKEEGGCPDFYPLIGLSSADIEGRIQRIYAM